MSTVDLIGTRTIDPFTCGAHPDDDDAVQRAQELLNAVAGGPRVRVDGSLGRETSAALASFQASEGLPETGALDRATLERLERRAAELAEARAAVEEPEETHESPTVPATAAPPERLAEVRAGLAALGSVDAIRERLTELAPRFGVVRGRDTDTTAETVDDQARRLRFLLRSIDRPAEVEALALNIERIAPIEGSDPGLAMAVMSMEGWDALTARSMRTVDVWHDDWNRTIGTRVHDDDLMHRPGLVASGPWRTEWLEGEDDGSTDRVEELSLWNVHVPERDMPLLTTAQLATYEDDFERTAESILGDGALDGLSEDARRTWVQLRFSGVGNMREMLERVRDSGGDPNLIVESPALGRDIHVAIARVRAMRAALFEEAFSLPAGAGRDGGER